MRILLIGLLTLFSGYIFAQNAGKLKEKEPIPNRIFVGGNLGLQFGSITLVDVSPLIGYWFTEDLAGGLGLTYQYFQDNRYLPKYSTNIFGARIFGRYFIFGDIFAHAEFEWMNFDAYDFFGDLVRVNVNNILVGGGYRQWVTDNSFISLELLWNVN